MNPKTLELVLSLLEAAGTMAAMLPTIGAKWRANRDKVQVMIDEDRDPTPEEHAEIARELHALRGAMDAALESAEAAVAPE